VKAVQAIRQAPGVLAVKVDYEKKLAIVGTNRNQEVPRDQILDALKSIGYRGEFIK
jgi:hypothetical protein